MGCASLSWSSFFLNAHGVLTFHAVLPEFSDHSVYPPCTSLRRIHCFYSFCRLVKSASYALSVGVRIPTPPASTICSILLISLYLFPIKTLRARYVPVLTA